MRMKPGVGLIGVQSTRAYAAELRHSILGRCAGALKYRQSAV